jgi:hypothetical protein
MKKNKNVTPDSFVIQIPARYTKGSLFSKPKLEKIVAEWAKKGYRLHSMTPVTASNFFINSSLVTHYALNFHKMDAGS